MMQLAIWATLTAFVTGGAWMAIVLGGQVKRLAAREEELTAALEAQQAGMAELHARLEATEVRLDEAERELVARQRPSLPPSPQSGSRS